MATKNASFPFTVIDDKGLCTPLRPPHPKFNTCTIRCNNDVPGNWPSWHHFNMSVRLSAYGPFGNKKFVDRMTHDKKLNERKKK